MPTSPSEPAPTRQATAARRWGIPFAVVGAITLVVLAGSVFGGGNNGTRSNDRPATTTFEAQPAADGTVTVLYEVEGDTDYADVTMETPTGTSQISPDVPMVRKSDGQRGLEMEFSPGDFLYLSAQNNRGYGTVVCRISVDGVVISENSASGGYAIATCKGSAP